MSSAFVGPNAIQLLYNCSIPIVFCTYIDTTWTIVFCPNVNPSLKLDSATILFCIISTFCAAENEEVSSDKSSELVSSIYTSLFLAAESLASAVRDKPCPLAKANGCPRLQLRSFSHLYTDKGWKGGLIGIEQLFLISDRTEVSKFWQWKQKMSKQV